MTTTQPADEQTQMEAADHLILAPYHKDPETGATWVHKDLVQVQDAWDEEKHISPPRLDERFGDVESFCAYVTDPDRQPAPAPLLTWNSHGLRAVLDYTTHRQWVVTHPFVLTPEFKAWAAAATNTAVEHRRFVEFLEDHAPDIFEPAPLDLLDLLRRLKGAANATFEGGVKADGTADISYAKSTSVSTGGSLALPPEITIAIPVLRGHVNATGELVRYKLVLKLRASVDGNAQLALRLAMPQAERVLEEVYSERVAAAKELLGDEFELLRAAD